uniref:Uncharacterized protein n=1 Tax=Trichogramma kaykai TaxID=54128 RepID=A0ABD2XU79_9HYME
MNGCEHHKYAREQYHLLLGKNKATVVIILSTTSVCLCFVRLWLGWNLSDERRLGSGWRSRCNLYWLEGDRLLKSSVVQIPCKTPARLYHRFSVTRTADARGYTRRLIPTTFITI